jgi:hypothetical protein
LPIAFTQLTRLRPIAYHTTTLRAVERIRATRRLESTTRMLTGTPYEHLLRGRRARGSVVRVGEHVVEIRDQKPLVLASLELEEGWQLQDLLDELNGRVFLWAGTAKGPGQRGLGHFQKYHAEGDAAVVRVPLPELQKANAASPLFVTRVNSGSARHHGGKPARRGPGTFVPLDRAPFPAREVIELSYREIAVLPKSTEWARDLGGPWEPLFGRAVGSNPPF